MKLKASIIFDPTYLEPALVTASELLIFTNQIDRLYLILVEDESQDSMQAREALLQFSISANAKIDILIFTVKNFLQPFNAFHFNNTIIYKGIIPSLITDADFILNVDAGVLPGSLFEVFLESLLLKASDPHGDWIVSAHCDPVSTELPAPLSHMSHHLLYPKGAILFFNSKVYRNTDWGNRYVEFYQKNQPFLRYAEQEIICVVSKDHELQTLPMGDKVCVRQLGVNSSLAPKSSTSIEESRDCVFFKFSGSFKPWKYWVLDYDKAIYLDRRAKFSFFQTFASYPLFEKYRRSCDRPEWAEQFLKRFEMMALQSIIKP